jgi:hypothetical protein
MKITLPLVGKLDSCTEEHLLSCYIQPYRFYMLYSTIL